MPATLNGVRCTALPIFKPLLKKWVTTNIDVVRHWQGDLAWWYGERASISVLAGAAWRIGGFAFEEYREDKKTGPGRVDLYLKVGRQQFIAEAKYCWSGATLAGPVTNPEFEQRAAEGV